MTSSCALGDHVLSGLSVMVEHIFCVVGEEDEFVVTDLTRLENFLQVVLAGTGPFGGAFDVAAKLLAHFSNPILVERSHSTAAAPRP